MYVHNAETADPVNWYIISGQGDCGEGDCGEGDCGEGEWIPMIICMPHKMTIFCFFRSRKKCPLHLQYILVQLNRDSMNNINI